jgi:hypothetical protein
MMKGDTTMTDFEQLIVRMQARRLRGAYSARGLEPPASVAKILEGDTDEHWAADGAVWTDWCHSHGLRSMTFRPTADTVFLEGDKGFGLRWPGEDGQAPSTIPQ